MEVGHSTKDSKQIGELERERDSRNNEKRKEERVRERGKQCHPKANTKKN